MPKDQDVLEFAQKAGAKEPEKGTELYTKFRPIFRRSNYLFLKDKMLIIKISHKNKPFWGVGKKYLDLLDGRFEYFLVLLVPGNEGWVFSETEVKRNIAEDTCSNPSQPPSDGSPTSSRCSSRRCSRSWRSSFRCW